MSTPESANVEELITAFELSESEYYRLLANERRRLLLNVLVDIRIPCTLTEVATEVTAREHAMTERPDADRLDVRSVLHHAHLPLLADIGVIDYHAEEHRIEAGQMSGELLTG